MHFKSRLIEPLMEPKAPKTFDLPNYRTLEGTSNQTLIPKNLSRKALETFHKVTRPFWVSACSPATAPRASFLGRSHL